MEKRETYSILMSFSLLVVIGVGLPIRNVEGDVYPQIRVQDRQILVDNKTFVMRGIGYSPVPIGVDPEVTLPYGDYFTSDFSAIYDRDLPFLSQMEANTIRLWGWNNNLDHTDFLNKAFNKGIYVIVTFWMAPNRYPDISSQNARAAIKADFKHMVASNKDNPAILMWAIGNELNANWMYGNHLDDLFSLINEMSLEAHQEEGATAHPVTTPLVDIDLVDTIGKYDKVVENLDVWSVQVYRGNSFGSLFSDYANVSSKPLAITEYGIDAYDNRTQKEYENSNNSYQAVYAESLWKEIEANSDICSGGCIMEYSDEWWKGRNGTPTDMDPYYHSTSGYPNDAHPDDYANEEWWGIMRTVKNGSNPDIMQPRAVYYSLQSLWPHPTQTPPNIPEHLSVYIIPFMFILAITGAMLSRNKVDNAKIKSNQP